MAAVRLASAGRAVTLLERRALGGQCVHDGCMLVCGLNDVARTIRNTEFLCGCGVTAVSVSVRYPEVMRSLEKVHARLSQILERETIEAGVKVEYGVTAEVRDGRVVVDGVVREAEAVITLVPLGVDVEATVNVDPKDIGWIRGGELARVKLGAYPFQRYGTLDGKVRTISEDTFSESTALGGNRSWYHVQLGLSGRLLPRAGNYRLVPGMQVMAEIKVGKRRIIEYLTDPLIKALDESCKEP